MQDCLGNSVAPGDFVVFDPANNRTQNLAFGFVHSIHDSMRSWVGKTEVELTAVRQTYAGTTHVFRTRLKRGERVVRFDANSLPTAYLQLMLEKSPQEFPVVTTQHGSEYQAQFCRCSELVGHGATPAEATQQLRASYFVLRKLGQRVAFHT